MSNKVIKPLTLGVGVAFIGSVALSQMVHANAAFQVKLLIRAICSPAPRVNAGKASARSRMMDSNEDGKVSLDEAKAAGRNEAQFTAMDTNKDGFPSDDEVRFHEIDALTVMLIEHLQKNTHLTGLRCLEALLIERGDTENSQLRDAGEAV